jgi:nitrogen fixation NifU-like protein
MESPEYSEQVWEHFRHPRNVGSLDAADRNVGTGLVEAPRHGDLLRVQLRVGAGDLIDEARFKAHGSGAVIAAASLATDWIKGGSLAQATAIEDAQIARSLVLPPRKIHCAVLVVRGILAAVNDYRLKQSHD